MKSERSGSGGRRVVERERDRRRERDGGRAADMEAAL